MTRAPECAARELLTGRRVQRLPPPWIRELRLAHGIGADAVWHPHAPPAHACSRFRSLVEPDRFARYSVRDAGTVRAGERARAGVEDHTLLVVREFRRVPLDASGLALMLFIARPGLAARLLAALAHWVERALSADQPSYMLLAHSLEYPSLAALLAGVHERRALQSARPSALCVAPLLPEITPLLETGPERYVYCPNGDLASVRPAVAPSAV